MEFNPFSLENKTILITGASSGIGQAIAIACSKMKANVIITGRNLQKLEFTLSLMDKGCHQILTADLTNKREIDNLVIQLPKLDGIVYNAGIGSRKLCKMIEKEDIDKVMNINFSSSVLLQSTILSSKKINKGASIVFIASRAATSPSIGNAIYSASKGAVISTRTSSPSNKSKLYMSSNGLDRLNYPRRHIKRRIRRSSIKISSKKIWETRRHSISYNLPLI